MARTDNLAPLNQERKSDIIAKQQTDGFDEYTYDVKKVKMQIREDSCQRYFVFVFGNDCIGWTTDHIAAFKFLNSIPYYTIGEVLAAAKEERDA